MFKEEKRKPDCSSLGRLRAEASRLKVLLERYAEIGDLEKSSQKKIEDFKVKQKLMKDLHDLIFCRIAYKS